jgi:hypothetical protein
MEALPGSSHTFVPGAVPVLCAKLQEINFSDLAEQSLSVNPLFFILLIMWSYVSTHSFLFAITHGTNLHRHHPDKLKLFPTPEVRQLACTNSLTMSNKIVDLVNFKTASRDKIIHEQPGFNSTPVLVEIIQWQCPGSPSAACTPFLLPFLTRLPVSQPLLDPCACQQPHRTRTHSRSQVITQQGLQATNRSTS